MSTFNSYSRDQLRLTLAQAWSKHLQRLPLSPLEALIADVVGIHPEYQRIVGDSQTAVAFEPSVADAENPFLHMGLHLAVREQLSIDRPPGIRDLHRRIQLRLGSPHDAEHALMEALGEALWRAQRSGTAPDENQYLEIARNRLKSLG
jgi:hypothetical protein